MPARTSMKFETGSEAGYKTLQKVVPIDIFLAAGITDGEGKKENRIVFRAKGDTKFYFLFAKGTEANMRPAAPWLQELLGREAGSQDAEIPEDLISDVPTGDPLED